MNFITFNTQFTPQLGQAETFGTRISRSRTGSRSARKRHQQFRDAQAKLQVNSAAQASEPAKPSAPAAGNYGYSFFVPHTPYTVLIPRPDSEIQDQSLRNAAIRGDKVSA